MFALTQPALTELLAAAEGLLAATGNAVALCPTYGRPETNEAGEPGREFPRA